MIPHLVASILAGAQLFAFAAQEDQRILRAELREHRIRERLISIDVREAFARFHQDPVALQQALDEIAEHWGVPSVGKVIVEPIPRHRPVGMRDGAKSAVK